MVGKRLVGSTHFTTAARPSVHHQTDSHSCKHRFHDQPFSLSSVTSSTMSTASEFPKHHQKLHPGKAPDMPCPEPLNAQLELLSLSSSQEQTPQHISNPCNNCSLNSSFSQEQISQQMSNPCHTCLTSKNSSTPPPAPPSMPLANPMPPIMDAQLHHQTTTTTTATPNAQHPSPSPPNDHHSSRNGYCLPTSLVSSPPSSLDSKHLDPNAREFTPSASSTSIQHHQVISLTSLGHAFSLPADMPCAGFCAEANGASFPAPPYGDGGPASYGTSWHGTSMGVGIPPARGDLPAYRPPMLVPPPHAHVGLLPVSLPHPPPSPAPLCSRPANDPQHIFFPNQFLSGSPPPFWKEHVSRALILTGVAANLKEPQLRKDLEYWGPIRALELERQQEGIVTVHYYDLRHAREALKAVQNQHFLKQRRFRPVQCQRTSPNVLPQTNYSAGDSQKDKANFENDVCGNGLQTGMEGLIGGNVVWAQYTTSSTMTVPDAHNQGTLVVFNIDADVPLEEIRVVFDKYGDVKELRETPSKRQHKFVEFYDVRNAATAWSALNGHEICGKTVKIEFSRPGGQARRAKAEAHVEMHGNGIQLSAGSVVPNGRAHNHMATSFRPFGWNGEPCAMSQCPTGAMIWHLNCPVGNEPSIPQQQWQGITESQPQLMAYPAPFCGAPSPSGMVMPSKPGPLVNRRTAADAELSYRSASPRYNGHANGGRPLHNGSKNGDASVPRRHRNGLCNGIGAHLKMDLLQITDVDKDGKPTVAPCESRFNGRTGLTPRSSPKGAHAQYVFDESEVHLNIESPRTTVMVRNIPNKYSQQMLLSLLDQHCLRCNNEVDNTEPPSAYDFVYLPIDFKNRCNLGYAFVNFTTALATLKFYRAFHDQAWEAFNSRKICQVYYARVQGRAALEDHFRNSRFACDTDEYLPLVFVPPRNGLECSPPRVAAGQISCKTAGMRVESHR